MDTTGGNRSFGFLAAAVIATAFVSHYTPRPAEADDRRAPATIPAAMAVDTPPRPVTRPAAEPGWPFQQLPMVAKFGVPERPRAELVPLRPPYIRVRTPPFPVTPYTPAPPGEVSPLWLLTPLAAGLAMGRVEDVGAAVVPEPASVVLLATGVVLLGLASRRRRTRDRWQP